MHKPIERCRIGVAALALACWACGSDDSSGSTVQAGGAPGTGGSSGAGGSVTGCTSDTGPGEPANNAEATAVSLPAMSDSDPATLPQITGMINGNSDVDWYTYTGRDDPISVVDPHVAFPSDLGLRLCMYFECLALTTLVTCPAGTTADRSSGGRTGCCATGNMTAFTVIDAYCGVTGGANDDSMRVFIRVDGPSLSASACVPYTVDYHY
jgi:hypothetical protein